MDLPSDLIDRLSEFDAERVEYLLIGGQAVALHGVPRFTKDAGSWLRDSPDNLERVALALKAFGAPPKTMDALRAASELDVVWMGHPPARIDLMKGVPGGDFSRAYATRTVFQISGQPVVCVGKSELIAQKARLGPPPGCIGR